MAEKNECPKCGIVLAKSGGVTKCEYGTLCPLLHPKRTAPTPGDWKLIEMPESWDIASQENRNTFGVFARIDKNEVFPGQARANALCMMKSKKALNILKFVRLQLGNIYLNVSKK